ncbi:MAG: TetR family transcriptional regulator [Nocardioides sp.]
MDSPAPSPRAKTSATSARGEARRRRIIEVATRLLARSGSRGTSLQEIATASGVTQTGLLHHFPTKEHLLNAVLDNRDEFENSLIWRYGDDPGIRVFDVVADVVSEWASRPELVGLMAILVAENVGDEAMLHDRLRANYRRTVNQLARTLQGAVDRREIVGPIDPDTKAVEVLAFLSGLELAWLVDPTIHAEAVARVWADGQTRLARSGTDTAASEPKLGDQRRHRS